MTLSRQAKNELASALLGRGDLSRVGRDRIETLHPNLPPELAHTLAFHLFTDGVEAMVDVLADAERLLRGEVKEVSYGSVSHALYHLYNYLLVLQLIPSQVSSAAEDVRYALDELESTTPDLNDVRSTLKSLLERLEGHTSPPEVP